MVDSYAAPVITEHLVIHRRVERPAGRRRGRAKAANDPLPAIELLAFLDRTVEPSQTPALARALTIILGDGRLPVTVTVLAKAAGTSRSTLWREFQALGLPRTVSMKVVIRAGLVVRVQREHEAGTTLDQALARSRTTMSSYAAAVSYVDRNCRLP